MKKHTNLDNEIYHKKSDLIVEFTSGFVILLIMALIAFLVAKVIVGVNVTNIAQAQTTVSVGVPCNNLNWQYENSPCVAPVETFEVDPITRNVAGRLTSGKEFTQTWYGNLMLFKMEDVCWLTNGYTTVYCDL